MHNKNQLFIIFDDSIAYLEMAYFLYQYGSLVVNYLPPNLYR